MSSLRAIRVLLVALVLTGQPARAEDPPKVTFVGYNLRNYLPMSRRVGEETVHDAPKPEEEVAALLRYLVRIKPDILGVCEIGGMDDVRDLQARLKAAGLDLPHHAWLDAFDTDRHLAVLSRFPIPETHSRSDLTFEIDGKEFAHRRGIIDATIQITESYSVRVLGVHLKSKRASREADHNLIRRNEAELLRKHVDRILEADPDANVLVFGDFNATRNEPPLGIIRGRSNSSRYLQPLDLEDEDGERWTYYWAYADQYSRFDFLFGSKGFVNETILSESYLLADREWYSASDHRPLVLRFLADDAERAR